MFKLPTFDPVTRVWAGVFVTFCIGISQGAIHLTDAIPDGWIKPSVAWAGIIAFVGSGLLTGLNGLATSTQSRLASAAAVPEVTSIITTSKPMADASGPKVITK